MESTEERIATLLKQRDALLHVAKQCLGMEKAWRANPDELPADILLIVLAAVARDAIALVEGQQ